MEERLPLGGNGEPGYSHGRDSANRSNIEALPFSLALHGFYYGMAGTDIAWRALIYYGMAGTDIAWRAWILL